MTTTTNTGTNGGGSYDMTFLMHVGVEIVIIGGLAFYIHKRTGELQGQVDMLNSKMVEYEKIIANQGELITKHENALQQIFSVMQGGQRIAAPQNRNQQPQNRNQQPQTPLKRNQPQPNKNNNNKPIKKNKSQVQDEEENEDINPEMDEYLQDELAELECNDDGSCTIATKGKKKDQ